MNTGIDFSKAPLGMHAVCPADKEKGLEPGAVYILKNINHKVNIENTNQLHPFYLVQISAGGEVISNHLNVKHTLDVLRSIAKKHPNAVMDLCDKFNLETDDGRKMDNYSRLLGLSIDSIIHTQEESDIDSLFSPGGTTVLTNDIQGLEDFELIAFMIIR